MDIVVNMRGFALDLLSRREHSRRELVSRLAERFSLPADDPALQSCLDRLAADGYQSDERFAEVFVRSRRSRGYGPLFIEQELRQRGIAQDVIATAVNRADDGWATLASNVKRKKFGSGWVSAMQERAKVVRFLRYRGFLPPQIDSAVQA